METTHQRPTLKMVGEYALTRKLGSGSFATVFKAYHKDEPKSFVALKAISRSKLNAKTQENLDSEIGILERIDHPNIVKLFGIQRTERNIYLVMEYCNGGDLHKFIHKNKSLPPHVVQHLMRDLAAGVKYLWTHNLIHRDLKPQNLLLSTQQSEQLDKNGAPKIVVTLKIADFGFARHLAEAGMAETLCGSPLYMAPEILRYEKYDAKADLWSVGAIMYEMLVGEPPYSGTNPRELLMNIERSKVSFPVNAPIPAECIALIRKLLTRSPQQRIDFAEFLRNPFISATGPKSVKQRTLPKYQSAQSGTPTDPLEANDFENALSSNNKIAPQKQTKTVHPPSESPLLGPLSSPAPAATVVLDTVQRAKQEQMNASKQPKDEESAPNRSVSTQPVSVEDQWCMVGPQRDMDSTTVLGSRGIPESPQGTWSHSRMKGLGGTSTSKEEWNTPQIRDEVTQRALAYSGALGDRACKLADLSRRFTSGSVFDELGISPCELDLPSNELDTLENSGDPEAVVGRESRISRLCGLALLVKACELLQTAVMAADDAMDASSVSGGLSHIAACTVASELRDRFSTCTSNARRILGSGLASGSIVPQAESVMYQVAVRFCECAIREEEKLTRASVADDAEIEGPIEGNNLSCCLRLFKFGLLLFELLAVGSSSDGEFVEPSMNDKRILRGFIASISMRIDKLQARETSLA